MVRPKNEHRRQNSENVKSGDSPKAKNQGLSATPKLARLTFLTSREMDFFSEKELVTQTGHVVAEWPLVVIKELVDNGLDGCEEADVAPVIDIEANEGGIAVRDNGPGIPEATLDGVKDYSVRASSREAYVAPDRGKQGNALKTLLPMPWVVDPDRGQFVVTSRGKRHVITCGADPITQRPAIRDQETDLPTSGTEVRLTWAPRLDGHGNVEWPFGNRPPGYSEERVRATVEGYALFNPHAEFRLDWFGKRTTWHANNTGWDKWKPSRPTSSHWYELRHLERLIGANIARAREGGGEDRLASAFLTEFDGFSGSKKRAKVLDEAGLHRTRLSEFVVGDRLDSERIELFLRAMQKHARVVQPKSLGIIGEDHFRQRLLAMGCTAEHFRYAKKVSKGGTPCVLEAAFGWLGDAAPDLRRIFVGANWSVALKNPFREFGQTGVGLEASLTDLKVGLGEPVVYVLHLAHPRVEYTDRGKSALSIGGTL